MSELEFLESLRANPALLPSSQDQLDKAVAFMDRWFGIRTGFKSDWDVLHGMECLGVPPKILARYIQLQEERSNPKSPQSFKRSTHDFYSLICRDSMLGCVHSRRWGVIVDSAVIIASLVRHLGGCKTLLDFGCHAGYHSAWFAQSLGTQVVGIDECESACRFGAEKAKQIGLSRDQISFAANLDSLDQPILFDVIVSIDGATRWVGDDLARIASLLAPSGIYVSVEEFAGETELKRALGGTGLDLLYADTVGGGRGDAFALKQMLVAGSADRGSAVKEIDKQSRVIVDRGLYRFLGHHATTDDKCVTSQFRLELQREPAFQPRNET